MFPETHLRDISRMILLIIKYLWEALKCRLQIYGARGFFHVACGAQIMTQKLPVFVGRQPTDRSICNGLPQFKWEEICDKEGIADFMFILWYIGIVLLVGVPYGYVPLWTQESQALNMTYKYDRGRRLKTHWITLKRFQTPRNKSENLRHLRQNLFSGVLKLYTKMAVNMTCVLVCFRLMFPTKVGFNERCHF